MPELRSFDSSQGRVTYILSGRGPSIVLFSGAGMTLRGWRGLYPRIEGLGRVLAWNRFGVKGSAAPRTRPTSRAVVAVLDELLEHTGLPPPYVLVAHSLGGLHASLFARLHPQRVAGVMLIESAHPRDAGALRRHGAGLARSLSNVLGLPQPVFAANLDAELRAQEASAAELLSAPAFPPVPLVVVTGGLAPPGSLLSPAAAGARRALQQDLARLSPRGEQVVAQRSGHFPQLTQPGMVLAQLRRLIRQARAGASAHVPAAAPDETGCPDNNSGQIC